MNNVEFLFKYEDEINNENISNKCVDDMLELYELQDMNSCLNVSSFDFSFTHVVISSFIEYLEDEYIDLIELKQKIKNRDISIYTKTIEIMQNQYNDSLKFIKNMLYNSFLDLYNESNKSHTMDYFKYSMFMDINRMTSICGILNEKTIDELTDIFYKVLEDTKLKFDDETIDECLKIFLHK